MADRRKKRDKNTRKKGSIDDSGANPNKLTKEEDAIARFVRFNCPTNLTMFEGNEVHYFSGKKAVDLLVESKKYGASAKNPKFADNEAAEDFLRSLLERGLFFRAKKLVPKKKDKGSTEKAGKSRDVSKSPRVEKAEKKSRKEEGEEGNNNEEKEEEEEKKEGQKQDEEKKKKKVKLLFHDIQSFDISTSDVYVWIFDPTPLWKKCVGILIVLGTIGGCLFPLWPDWLRLGIYYLSVTGIALFGLLIGVAIARTILFGIIWLFSMGRHHLWILPNLMEDCGFFESFQPAYTYEYVQGGMFAKKEQKKKKKKDKEEEEKGGEKEAENKEEEAEEEKGRTRDSEEKTPLIPQTEHQEQEVDAITEAPKDSPPPLDQIETTSSSNHDGIERKSSAESEAKQSKTSGSGEDEEDEDEEEGQVGTDDSNSWEKLSENSQAAEGDKREGK